MLLSIRVTKSPLLCSQKQYVVLVEAFVVCNIGVEYIAALSSSVQSDTVHQQNLCLFLIS